MVTRRPPPAGERDQRGQATVEFALVLPLIAALLLLIVQVGLVMRDELLVTHAAREAARAAAVDPGADVLAVAQARTGISGLTVTADNGGDVVVVHVHYDSPIRLPLLNRFSVGLDASASMRVETG